MIPRSLLAIVAVLPLACSGTSQSGSGSGGAAGSGGTVGATGGVGTGGGGATGNLCDLPAEPGTCTNDLPMFYFDAELDQCAAFTYSGCGGNANRFATALSCMSACGGDVPDLCALPAETGPCDAAIPSYHFDPSTGQCNLFSYGGCEGNANRFATETECLATCGDIAQTQCPLTMPTGACATEGAACTYGQYDQCLCVPYDTYWCEPVPACYGDTGGTGTGGASGFAPPPTGGSDNSSRVPAPVGGGGSSSDIAEPAPATTLCSCTAGSWQCQMMF
jgi:hypothetical protein